MHTEGFHTLCIPRVHVYANSVCSSEFNLKSGSGIPTGGSCVNVNSYSGETSLEWLNWLAIVKNLNINI